MKENIKAFATPAAADNYTIEDVPFMTTAKSTGQNLCCAVEGKKIKVVSGVMSLESAGPEMVDLGLTSGTLWAKTNIGAQNETDYGQYFAWGEIAQHAGWPEDKTSHPYDWNEYIYAESSYNELTKYCNDSKYGYQGFTDGKTVLEATDDVATVVLGAGYKMPTKAQFEELIEETNNEWTTINGVSGYKFTNKSDSSKYIFLPAAGCCDGSNLYGVGGGGLCWSSSLYAGNPGNAWYLFFYNGGVNMDNRNRCYGLSIRPVRSANS